MRRTILLLAGAVLLLVSVDAGAVGIRPSSVTASASRQHERTITARLQTGYGYFKGALLVTGRLRSPDGLRACGREQPVKFQRLVSDRWLNQDRGLTGKDAWVEHANGFVMVGKSKHPNGSEWRVVAPESTLADGDVCLSAVSPVMVHHHRDRS